MTAGLGEWRACARSAGCLHLPASASWPVSPQEMRHFAAICPVDSGIDQVNRACGNETARSDPRAGSVILRECRTVTCRDRVRLREDRPVGISAAHAAAFYREATRRGAVWGVRDDGGFPAPLNGEGVRAIPFWSLQPRAETVIRSVPAYAGFVAVQIPLTEWRASWLPRMQSDGLLVGINWSGERARGYDVQPEDAEAALVAVEA